jgi:hypothetical protein
MRGDPYYIKNKYPTKCAETGVPIPVGVNVLYEPRTKKVYLLSTRRAQEWAEIKADDQFTNHSF